MITDKVGGSSAKPEVSKQSKEKRLKHKVSGYKSQSKRRLIAGCRLLLRTLHLAPIVRVWSSSLAKKKTAEKILLARKKKRKIKKILLLFVQIYLLFSFLGCWLNTLKTEVIGLANGRNGKVMFMLDQCLWQQLFSLLLFTSIFKL